MKQKNHEFLIDLFNILYKENHKFKLLLIGQGPLENQIKNKVNSLKLNENVIFCEQRDDVNRYMQAMDCFVFPSLFAVLGAVVGWSCCLAKHQFPANRKKLCCLLRGCYLRLRPQQFDNFVMLCLFWC